MELQLVVFDLAGTTVKDNYYVPKILQQTLSRYDVNISLDDAAEVMGLPKPVAIRMLLEKNYDGKNITEQWINEIHVQFVEAMIGFYETSDAVEENEGVSETFTILKQKGIKIAVDTGFDRSITDTLLSRMQWIENGLIDCSVTSDEVQRGRPYPDLIFEAMKRTGVKVAANVVKVGDTASDIQEGKAAGCGVTIGITSGAFAFETLQRENPSFLIASIPEILPLLFGPGLPR